MNRLPIEYYCFEIRPFETLYRGGTAKLLVLTITVNGQKHQVTKPIDVISEIPAWQTELQFYSHIATLALEEKLKQLETEANDQPT